MLLCDTRRLTGREMVLRTSQQCVKVTKGTMLNYTPRILHAAGAPLACKNWLYKTEAKRGGSHVAKGLLSLDHLSQG